MASATTLIAQIRTHVNVQLTNVLGDADILEALNDTQERMVQQGTAWQAMDLSWEFDTTPSIDGVPLFSGLLRIYGVFQKDLGATDPSLALIEVGKTTRRDWLARANAPDVNRDFPRPGISGLWYYLHNGRIYFGNQPGSLQAGAGGGVRIVVDYQGAPPDLTSSGVGATNYFTSTYPRTLFWGATARVNDHLKRDDDHDRAEQRFLAYLERAKVTESAKKSSGAPAVRGQ